MHRFRCSSSTGCKVGGDLMRCCTTRLHVLLLDQQFAESDLLFSMPTLHFGCVGMQLSIMTILERPSSERHQSGCLVIKPLFVITVEHALRRGGEGILHTTAHRPSSPAASNQVYNSASRYEPDATANAKEGMHSCLWKTSHGLKDDDDAKILKFWRVEMSPRVRQGGQKTLLSHNSTNQIGIFEWLNKLLFRL